MNRMHTQWTIAWGLLLLAGLLMTLAGCGPGRPPGVTPEPLTEMAPPQTTPDSGAVEPVVSLFQSPIQTPTPTPTPWIEPPPPTRRPTPTATAFWTLTLRPTPTRRPGPTATPFPTRGPAPDPSGMILYVPSDRRSIMGLPIDRQGQKVAEAAPLPLSLDFNPILGPSSPDGRYLLLLWPVEPGGVPYVFDLQTQQLRPLFKGHPRDIIGWAFWWHPDSHQMLFWEHDFGLWLVDVETGEFTILALIDGPVQGAAISPDGQEIVYVARSDLSYRTMWEVSSAGSDARPLFDLGGPSYVFGWSPAGSYILYAGGSNVGFKDAAAGTPVPGGPLWLIDLEGQNGRPLSGHFLFGWGFEPVWSPNGQWIAFTGPDTGQGFGCAQKDPRPDPETCMFEGTAIYIENIQTGEVRRLTSGIEPVWSPDGSMLAFLSNQSGAPEVWVIRAEGTALQQLTADAQQKWWVAWVPAGR